MKHLRLILICCASCFAHPQAGAADDNLKADSFTSVIQEHFNRWFQNDSLAAGRVVNLIIQKKPRITGDAAAALVAIHNYQEAHKDVPVTREFLLRPPRSDKAAANLEKDFQRARKRIATASRELFIGRAPTLNAIHQRERGDCFFLAPVGAAISSNPHRIRRLFDIHDDGSFDVVLSEQHKEHFAPLTDAQIGLIDDYEDQTEGLWLAGLELAMGRRYKAALHTPSAQGKTRPMSPVDRIAQGGHEDEVMAQLTGHHIAQVEIRQANAAKIRAAAKAAHTHLVCLGIDGFSSQPPGMVSEHVYAILGYDAKSDTIHMWNPWGDSHQPKGPPGPSIGYATENGHFHMPMRDLLNNVKGRISHETNQAPTKEDRITR
jgi:hypothetical protein